MSVAGSLTAVQNAIINHMTDYTTDNCSVHDEAVFNYIQTTADAPQKCCVVAYDGGAGGMRSEFRSLTMTYNILVNAFFMIPDEDYMTPVNDAVEFIDDFVLLCAGNPRLDGGVMRALVSQTSEPLYYARSSFNYILVSITVEIMDNIGG